MHRYLILAPALFVLAALLPLSSANAQTFTKDLWFGVDDPEVRTLQQFLNDQGFTVSQNGPGSPGRESDKFRKKTERAVIDFQEAYAADILAPLGLRKGTGYWGELSRDKAHELLGEDTASAPAIPTNLTATADSSSQISLTWDDVSTETEYILERSAGDGFSPVATLSENTTAYADSDLSSNTTYYYRVKARNSAGDSGYSGSASATTDDGTVTTTEVPAAPTNLRATADSSSQISLSWDDVENEVYYIIERSEGDGFSAIGEVAADTTSHTDSGLTGNTAYSYRVKARNEAGDSAYSNVVDATTESEMSAPAFPSNFSATADSTSQITVSWDDVADETSYILERSTGSGFSQIVELAADTTNYADSGLSSGTTHYYRIKARNSSGDSEYSETASATTQNKTDTNVLGDFQGRVVSSLSSISPSITLSKESNQVPFMLQVSAMDTTANGSNSPYDELEYHWNFGDANGSEFFTDPVTGQVVNANSDQTGPEAAYVYKNPGTYTVTLTVRGYDGSEYIEESTTDTVTVESWGGETRYVDPAAGNDSADGTSPSTAWRSWTKLDDWFSGGNKRVLIKRGTVLPIQTRMTIAGHSMQLGAYGEGAKPIIRAEGEVYSMFRSFANSGGSVVDHVFSDIRLEGNGNVSNTFYDGRKTSTGEILDGVFFIDSEFAGEACGHVMDIGGGERIGLWNVDVTKGSCSGHGALFGAQQWLSVLGGSYEGGDGNWARSHHIYPNVESNGLFRWIDFNPPVGDANFCINTNWDGKSESAYILTDAVDCEGMTNGIDHGHGGGEYGWFNNVIVQNSSFHDLATGGILGQAVEGKISIRDNVFYGLGNEPLAISHENASVHFYRNKVWTDSIYAVAVGIRYGDAEVFDNVIVNESSGGEYLASVRGDTDADISFSNNQYWAPNIDQPFGTGSGWQVWDRMSFSEWQGMGYDLDSVIQDPGWTDPANGDFSSGNVLGTTNDQLASALEGFLSVLKRINEFLRGAPQTPSSPTAN